MLILLLDIVKVSNSLRCHYCCFTLVYTCIVLMFRCGFGCATETRIMSSLPPTTPSSSSTSSSTSSSQSSYIHISPSPDRGKMQDGLTMDSLHASEHDIRLEDIFWSGSGDDEPLTFSLKSNARLAANSFVGRETFIKTATVVATVYVDGNSDEDENDPECNSRKCDDPNQIDNNYLSSDKRYWLVTTVSAILTDDDIPMLEERLSDLYRIAFTRQQSIHLGLSNATYESTTELSAASAFNVTPPILDNKQNANVSTPILPTTILKYESSVDERTSPNLNNSINTIWSSSFNGVASTLSENVNSTRSSNTASFTKDTQTQFRLRKRSVSSVSVAAIIPTPIAHSTQLVIRPTAPNTQPIVEENRPDSNSDINTWMLKSRDNAKATNEKKLKDDKKRKGGVNIGRINVMIHNISVISDGEKDYADDLAESIAHLLGNSSAVYAKETDNQTEIIYTVFVNGIPVLATIAANDMKFLTDAEVSKAIDKPIYTKAEPYLKEPLATPLIPSSTMSTHHNNPILAMVFQNPYLLAFAIALILLIILLLMILMVVAASQGHRTSKNGRLISRAAQTSSQQSSLPPPPFPQQHVLPPIVKSDSISEDIVDDHTTIRTHATNEIENESSNLRQKQQVGTQITSIQYGGNDNFAYERDHNFILISSPPKRQCNKKVGTPTIFFPQPPSSAPSSPSASSSSDTATTSDASSIYYIKQQKYKPPRKLYAKKAKQMHALNHREYAKITKKQIERVQKQSQKQKRKYAKSNNSNRVGVFEETVQVHSSHSSVNGQHAEHETGKQLCVVSDDTFESSDGKNSHFYEHIEAFNPMVGKSKSGKRFVASEHLNGNYKKTRKNSTESDYNVQKTIFLDETMGHTATMKYSKKQWNATEKRSSAKNRDAKHKRKKNQIAKVQEKQKSEIDYDEKHFDVPLNDEAHRHNDNLSIGSFLSMASIQSFPKCTVPEPLNRVLEPVSITYLDRYDETEAIGAATARIPRIVDTKVKNKQIIPQHESTDKVTGENVYLTRTRSDGADPGVIGPVVWEIHKKRLDAQDSLSPLKDPIYVQNRYAGLLEGAISLYSVETTECRTIETVTKEEFPGLIIPKDLRGKSAETSTNFQTQYTLSNTHRPFTAMPSTFTASMPPSPLKTAWTSATPSPFIRSASAGPSPTQSAIINSTSQTPSTPFIDSIHSNLLPTELPHHNDNKE